MTTYGVTDEGFVKKPLEVILSEAEASIRENISATMNLLASGTAGQLNGIYSDRESELWDVMEALYAAQNPDNATGAALDYSLALTGTTRLEAEPSTVTIRLYLEDGTTIPIGSTVAVGESGNQFETTEAATNSLGYDATFTVEAESSETGEIQGLSGTIDTIITPVSGWSAATAISSANAETYALSNGQTLTVKIDGGSEQTATFNTGDFVAIGSATAAEVAAVIDTDITGATSSDEGGFVRIYNESDATGNSIEVTGGTANTALGFSTTIVKGFNALDASLGRDIETDAEARLRREELLQRGGAATPDSIRSNVRDVDGVTSCKNFENRTMAVDGDGLPAKSYEIVVLGGDTEDIAQVIWDYGPAGIEDYGSSSDVIVDGDGNSQTIYFTRPTELDMYIIIDVTVDSALYPTDGDDQVAAALAAYGDDLEIGDDVIVLAQSSLALDVAGVTDVTVFKVDEANPPVNTANYTVGSRELAVFDTSRITVNS